MDITDIIRFFRIMFLTGGDDLGDLPPGVISPDFARDIAFTALTFVIGWAFSLRASKGRLKGRIIDELILSQRELVSRAYPEVRDGKWKVADAREAWMLDPFVARIKFLIASLQEEKSLGAKQLDMLEHYVTTLEDFIAQWSNTSRRGTAYHYKYKQSYLALRMAVKALGLTQMKRLGGLMPRDDLLDGGASKESAPTTNGLAPGGAYPAPAE